MMRSLRSAAVGFAIAGVAALAGPAGANAEFPVWDPPGAADAAGTLTFAIGSATTTCDVDMTLDLENNGTSHGGDVTSATFTSCTTNISGCASVTVADVSPPWTITKITNDESRLGIDGVQFTSMYSGPNCSLNGASITFTGDLEGDYDASTGTLSFDAAPGLTTLFGPALTSGSIEITYEGEDTLVGYEH